MKSISYYEKQYQKELELADKHKKNAADIRKQIDAIKGKMTLSAINALNLNGSEYEQLLKLLKQDKKSVLEAVQLITGEETINEKEREEEGEENEKTE